MLTQPETQHGRLVSLSGTAKRVQKIAIDEPDIQQRFGIDHYYQVDVFVSLDNTEIRFEPKGGKKEAPVFRNNYPVTCCVLALPAGLPARDDISVPVRFAGVYFKLWAYKSEYVSAFDDRQRQVSPLFIATTPRVAEVRRLRQPALGLDRRNRVCGADSVRRVLHVVPVAGRQTRRRTAASAPLGIGLGLVAERLGPARSGQAGFQRFGRPGPRAER